VLVNHGADADALGPALFQHFQQEFGGMAGVHDVFHEQHMLARHIHFHVLAEDGLAAAAGAAAVAGHAHEVDFQGVVLDVAHQIGKKEERTLEHADHHKGLALVAGGDLRAQLGHALVQRFGIDDGLQSVGHDL